MDDVEHALELVDRFGLGWVSSTLAAEVAQLRQRASAVRDEAHRLRELHARTGIPPAGLVGMLRALAILDGAHATEGEP